MRFIYGYGICTRGRLWEDEKGEDYNLTTNRDSLNDTEF